MNADFVKHNGFFIKVQEADFLQDKELIYVGVVSRSGVFNIHYTNPTTTTGGAIALAKAWIDINQALLRGLR